MVLLRRISRVLQTAALLAAVPLLLPGGLQATEIEGESNPHAPAREILEATGVQGGLIVHLGCGNGALTAALRAGDRYLVHGLDTRTENVRQARQHIQSLGRYGPVSVVRYDGRHLPYVDNLVNLLVAEEPGDVPMDEIMRVLAPRGVAYLKRNGGWTKTLKPRPAGIDEWTHWLHGPDGNAVAQDEVAGPPRGLQWIAGPLWSRHHNTVPSVSAFVTAGGRLFAVVDEAPPGMHGAAPDRWALIARDAMNGLPLWRIPLPEWGWRAWSADWHCRFTVPTHVPRRLVAAGNRVYATLGFNAPLSEIDAATGEVLRTFPGTDFTDEILYQDGLLILSINQGPQRPSDTAGARQGEAGQPPVRKWVAAVDAATGEMLWKTGDYVGLRSKTGSMDRISHLTLAAGGGRVFFIDRDRIVAIDLTSGKEAWQVPRPEVPEHKMRYNIRITDMCSLVYYDGLVLFAQLDPDRRIDWRQVRGKIHAFSAETGAEQWSRPCASWGWGHPADVLAVGGLVWVHDFQTPYLLGLDPATGEVKQKTSNFEAFDNGHHHRCYRNKATTRFLMTSYRGLEFIPWQGDRTDLNHWVRGTCRLGAFPANGLVYATPHPCDCYITAKLNGFVALGPESKAEGPTALQVPRLQRGTAFPKIHDPQSTIHDSPDPAAWPTYRHDARRSGTTDVAVDAELRTLWEASLGGRPTACTVAQGIVLAASVETHEVCALGAEDGRPRWRFTAGGPVDTPPTICVARPSSPSSEEDVPETRPAPICLFGSHDGYVHCLRLTDGEPVWRFRAAPCDRLVGAFGRLESAWPVYGSVLVDDGRAYVTAGRSSFLDGGIFAYCLDARTGEVLRERNVRTAHDMPVDTGRDQAEYYGVLPDVLTSNGNAVTMRGLPLFDTLGGRTKASVGALRATGGLLGDSWFNRTHWYVDGKPAGELLVCDGETIYGVRAYATMNADAGFFKPGAGGYELFALVRRSLSARKPKAGKSRRWSARVPVRIIGMVLAGSTLFAAGTPDVLDPDDPWAAYEGRRGGVLLAFSATDGKKLSEHRLDAAPVYDGLAAAAGRLYVSTVDGRIHCLGGR